MSLSEKVLQLRITQLEERVKQLEHNMFKVFLKGTQTWNSNFYKPLYENPSEKNLGVETEKNLSL
jgi:hypothetical protein